MVFAVVQGAGDSSRVRHDMNIFKATVDIHHQAGRLDEGHLPAEAAAAQALTETGAEVTATTSPSATQGVEFSCMVVLTTAGALRSARASGSSHNSIKNK